MRQLHTYEVFADKVNRGNRIGWRKTLNQAVSFADVLARQANHKVIIIVPRKRKKSDFNY